MDVKLQAWGADPYEDAQPVGVCARCGAAIYAGDVVYMDGDEMVGCESCTAPMTARGGMSDDRIPSAAG